MEVAVGLRKGRGAMQIVDQARERDGFARRNDELAIERDVDLEQRLHEQETMRLERRAVLLFWKEQEFTGVAASGRFGIARDDIDREAAIAGFEVFSERDQAVRERPGIFRIAGGDARAAFE